MPCTSAVRAASSTAMTPVRCEVSSRCAPVAPKRNRFELGLPSRTGVPAGTAR